MKKMEHLFVLSLSLGLLIATTGCSADDDNGTNPGTERLEKGIFGLVINEGGFQQGNASLGLYNFDTEEYTPQYFQSVTNFPLGDVFQSIHIADDIAYLIVNNSSKIEVLSLNPLEYLGSISGLPSPRYMAVKGDFAVVSNLFGNSLSRVDLGTLVVTSAIDFPGWSEEMLWMEDNLLVSCPTCPALYLIDVGGGRIIDSVPTQPNSGFLRKTSNDYILSYSSGSFDGETAPSLTLLNQDLDIIDFVEIQAEVFIGAVAFDDAGQRFLYFDGNVMSISVGENSLGQPELYFNESELLSVYSMSISNKGLIFLTNARDFSSQGEILIYDNFGNLIDRFEAGVVPSSILEY